MFQRASKTRAKLRAALFGPSGSGKTYTALRIASGMGGPIAVIDSEHGSASKYADRFEFDVADLDDKSIAGYSAAIRDAGDAGYGVLIIDSLSHAWQQLLTQIDDLAKTKYRGNTWSAWNEGTPQQRMLVEAILSYPGHVIATMRSKTAWEVQKSDNGKTKPTRIGLEPEQGKGIEYEFDMLVELNSDHYANVIKDRTGKFQDRIIEKPGEDFGKELIGWLNEGSAPKLPPPKTPTGASWTDWSREERFDYMRTRIAGTSDMVALGTIRDKITGMDIVADDKQTLLALCETALSNGNINGIVADGHSKRKEKGNG